MVVFRAQKAICEGGRPPAGIEGAGWTSQGDVRSHRQMSDPLRPKESPPPRWTNLCPPPTLKAIPEAARTFDQAAELATLTRFAAVFGGPPVPAAVVKAPATEVKNA